MNKKIILLFIINTFVSMGYSIIAPLFPVLGRKISLSENVLGWIISLYSLADFIITPFTLQLIFIFGRKHLFYLTNITLAIVIFIYGLLVFVNNYYIFLLISFTLRLIHGLSGGIVSTLIYSLGVSLSSAEEIVTTLGYLEIAWSLGVSIGPVLASFLYHFGGFSLPFYTIGALFLIEIYYIHILNISDEISSETPNFFQFFNLEMFTNFVPTLIFQIAQTYYFPSLTYHLTDKWNLSIEASSLFFMIGMAAYLIILQILKKILGNFGLILTIFLGQIVIIFGAPFVYPLEFLPQSILSIIFGLALLGSSGAFTCVAVIIQYGKIAKKIKPSLDDSTSNDIASAVFNLGINVGDFIGPVYGGIVSSNFGFKYSNIYMSVIAFISSIYFYLYYRQGMNEVIKDIFVNGFSKIRYSLEDEKKCERIDIKASRSRKSSISKKGDEEIKKNDFNIQLNEAIAN